MGSSSATYFYGHAGLNLVKRSDEERDFVLVKWQRIGENTFMKSLPGTCKAAVVIIGLLGCAVILSCANHQNGSSTKGNVEITENGIVIHPTITLSPAKTQALNDVLKHFSKSLYKIEKLEKGQTSLTRGSLSDAFMTAALKSEVANAKTHGASDWTYQFVTPNPTARNWGATSSSKKLIQKVTPILEKYR